jgi:hypothetical protein
LRLTHFRRVEKLRKATISFAMSVRPTVRPLGTTLLCSIRGIFVISDNYTNFFQSVEKMQVSLKSDQNKGFMNMRTHVRFCSHFAHFFSELKIFRTNLVDKNQNLYFTFGNFFFENLAVYEITRKNIVQPERIQMT